MTNLLEQWDSQRNLPLTTENISRGSKQKVWWRCEKGHSWQAAIYTRTGNGTSCPICAGRLPLAGETDLSTRYPGLARQWHPVKNSPLTPDQVLPGSHRMVWWICDHGHEWRAAIKTRVEGHGCPVCNNRTIVPGENDFAVRFPELVAQWHPTKNGVLDPYGISPGSKRKVWWRCPKGHEWQASITSRALEGRNCPVCAGKKVVPGENDLASRFPEIAAQWHPTKNEALSPTLVSVASNRKVWWRCELGHEYQTIIANRTMRHIGCPYCSGKRVLPGFNDLASLEPELAKQWHPTLNDTLKPEMVTAGSHRKVWWICAEGHVWKSVIYSRTGVQKSGCPICAGRVSRKRLEQYERIAGMATASMLKAPAEKVRSLCGL